MKEGTAWRIDMRLEEDLNIFRVHKPLFTRSARLRAKPISIDGLLLQKLGAGDHGG